MTDSPLSGSGEIKYRVDSRQCHHFSGPLGDPQTRFEDPSNRFEDPQTRFEDPQTRFEDPSKSWNLRFTAGRIAQKQE